MSENADINERLEYLEAQNEGLKRVGLLGLILVFILGSIVVYQSYADLSNVTTRGLVFLDESGFIPPCFPMARPIWRWFPFNPNEQLPNVKGDVVEGLRGMCVYDTKGHPRVAIGVDGLDNPVIMVFNQDGSIHFSATEIPEAPQSQPEATPTPASPATATPTPAP